MANSENYLAAKAQAESIPQDKIIQPTVPVKIFSMEAENLGVYAKRDQDLLVAKGLNPILIDELPYKIDVLKDSQSAWMTVYNAREVTLEEWKIESEKAYAVQRELSHDFRFAYRNDHNIMLQVNRIYDGDGHADLIQDLSDYAALGRANPGPLLAVNFDLSRLDLADGLSDSIQKLLGQVNGIRTETNKPEKMFRDQAYTSLKQSVDEIRDFGKYVFWEDEAKLKLYRSEYFRKLRSQQNTEEEIGHIL